MWQAMGMWSENVWWGCREWPTSPSSILVIIISSWDPFPLIWPSFSWGNLPTQKWYHPWSPLHRSFFSPPSQCIHCIEQVPRSSHHHSYHLQHHPSLPLSYIDIYPISLLDLLLVGHLLLGHSRWQGYLYDVIIF